MTGPDTEATLPSFEALTGPEGERDPGELHAELLHMTGAADRRPARRRADLPDTGSLRERMGLS